jgi:probable phosphoglycerate mutase
VPNTGLVVLRPGNGVATGSWELEHWDRAVPVPGDVTAGGAPA